MKKNKFNILTFNWHETYIYTLAKTGHQFDIVEKHKGGYFGWIYGFRPLPVNGKMISEVAAIEKIKNNQYDLIICHNITDLLLTKDYPTPKIFIFHNMISCEIALSGNKYSKADYINYLKGLITKNVTPVFISQRKKNDVGIEGEIITPGIDLSEYGGYVGNELKVLRVGNFMKERNIMMGFSEQEKILKGIPSTICGINPTIPSSHPSESWEKLKELFKTHRVYLNTTIEEFEDGYNLAMLEAMATGTPVVSLMNTTSPIIDGKNGYISDNPEILHERIKSLFLSPKKAILLGEKGRETIAAKFNIDDFIRKWNELFNKIINPKISMNAHETENENNQKLRVLLSYTSNPLTTGVYIENSLRRFVDLLTYGPIIGDETLKSWDLLKIKHLRKNHQINYSDGDLLEVMKKLPQGWIPDLFLWVESGVFFPLDNLDKLPCITACYLIDSHINLDFHLKICKGFKYVFIAQREYLPKFKEAGCKNVFWLPLACDPTVQQKFSNEKTFEISFVGSLNNVKRIKILESIAKRFPLHIERCFLEEMAMVFSKSKIIFNISAKDDLNMRVFETLATGTMLITDEAPGSGLTDFFKDREHLVIYHNENELLELIDYYLKNEAERENIAFQGRDEVLKKHTYINRIKELLSIIETEENKKENIALIDQTYYQQPRKEIVSLVPAGTGKILDVGCAEGIVGKTLLQNGAKEVVGIELNPDAAKKAGLVLSRAIQGDIEKIDIPYPEEYFDCIICADVLEHLHQPLDTVKKLHRFLKTDGILITSVPNVQNYKIILNLVNGYWTYQDYGIMDKTHLRFFTEIEINRLLISAGFTVISTNAGFDQDYYNYIKLDSKNLRVGRLNITDISPDEYMKFFVVQFLITAKKN